jgi:hypothetical protein
MEALTYCGYKYQFSKSIQDARSKQNPNGANFINDSDSDSDESVRGYDTPPTMFEVNPPGK